MIIKPKIEVYRSICNIFNFLSLNAIESNPTGYTDQKSNLKGDPYERNSFTK